MAGNNEKPENHGFEHSDVNVIAVGKVGVALLLVTIAAMALLFGLFNYFKQQEGAKAVAIDPTTTFPQPQLEKTPVLDLQSIRAAEDETLASYSWVDRDKGVVRIPISRAMDLLVQKGLPVVTPAPSGASTVSVPTESGLGPKMLPPGGPLRGGK